MKKAKEVDGARIAVLILIDKYTEAEIFKKEQLEDLIMIHFPTIKQRMSFKVKKFFLPTLITITPHLEKNTFEKEVFQVFCQFAEDDVWSVRKVCFEKISQIVKYASNQEKVGKIMAILKQGFFDSSRWARLSAYQGYGEVLFEASKRGDVPEEQLIKFSDAFFSQDAVKEEAGVSDIVSGSFMNNSSDDIDRIRHCWAFNLPAALDILGSYYWQTRLFPIYAKLQTDIQLCVRKTLASSFGDVIKRVMPKDCFNQEMKECFEKIIKVSLDDIDEIRIKILPHLPVYARLLKDQAESEQFLV